MADATPAPFMLRSDAAPFLAEPSSDADWQAWANYSSALYVSGRTDEAFPAAVMALDLFRCPATLLNLGMIFETRGRFDLALPLAREAYDLDPASGKAQCWLSDSLLRAGRFREAWPIYPASHADWGWIRAYIREWDGCSSLANKRLLVLAGGGFGDNILYLRWMSLLHERGTRVTYRVPHSLSILLERQRSAFADEYISGVPDPRDYDFFTCTTALGAYFCPEPSAIPLAPYIHAQPSLPASSIPRIGLCTTAGDDAHPRQHRILSDWQAGCLLSAPDPSRVEWINLNVPVPIPGIPAPPICDWLDTARLIASCDLIVSVDTGVAHLAGAMGKRAWIILPGHSAAYYGIDSERSMFYTSQRLFRNRGEGLDNAVRECCRALESWRIDA